MSNVPMYDVPMVPTLINDRWTLILPKHRADRPEWATGWERERWDSIAANIRPGDRVIDVGTEEGDLSALLATWVGPDGRLLLMEPNPKVWPNIRAIFEANGLDDGRARAWSGFAGPADRLDLIPPYRVDPSSARRHTIWPESAYGPLIGDHGFCVLDERPDLPAIMIDTICRAMEEDGQCLDLITMDVEGAELEVLHGAARTIERCHPLIYVSVHHEFMRSSFGRDSAELWTFLGDMGYRWTRLAVDHEDHVVWHHPDGREFRDVRP